MIKKILIDSLEFELHRKRVKYLRLSIKPDGRAVISVPKLMPEDFVRKAISEKLDWVRENQQKMKNRPQPKLLQYVTGEEHEFFGEKYQLQIAETTKRSGLVELDKIGQQILVYLPTGLVGSLEVREKVQNLLDDFYRTELRKLLAVYMEKWQPIMQVEATFWNIKRMRTRWGSCNTRRERVWFGLELAKKPLECVEYVVVHELAHLLEPSHNHRFKSILDHFFPGWREVENRLNGIASD